MPEENRQYLVRLGGMTRMEQALITQLSQGELRDWVTKYAGLYQEMMAYYRCAMMAVETKFNVLNEELSLRYDRNPIETVKTRLKAPESIIDKMVRRGFPLTVESIEQNIHDIAGVRVICAFPSDIYNLADMFLRQDDIHLLEPGPAWNTRSAIKRILCSLRTLTGNSSTALKSVRSWTVEWRSFTRAWQS